MSERVLRVLLSELATVRIRCLRPECGMVYEMTLAAMKDRNFTACPCCRQPLVLHTKGEFGYDLSDLAKTIAYLANAQAGTVGVEFVLPVSGE